MWRDRKRRAKKNAFFKRVIFLVLLFLLFVGSVAMMIQARDLFKRERFISPLPKEPAQSVIVKETIKSSGTQALSELLKKHTISFSKVDASDSAYIVVLENGAQVILSSEKDLANQVTSLQLVLTRLTIEGKGFSRLDLRFDKPVVVFR